MSGEDASVRRGEAVWRQSVALAGALAEFGVARVAIAPGVGQACEWTTRGTDLPGLLTAASAGTLIAVEEFALEVERGWEGLRVTRAESNAARAIARCLEGAG